MVISYFWRQQYTINTVYSCYYRDFVDCMTEFSTLGFIDRKTELKIQWVGYTIVTLNNYGYLKLFIKKF